MSTVRQQLIVNDIPHNDSRVSLVSHPSRVATKAKWLIILCTFFLLPTTVAWSGDSAPVNQDKLLTTIHEYAHAVGKDDRVAAGQRDFVCLMKMPSCTQDNPLI